MNGGSNFGELLGAVLVLLTANTIKTPIPWLRLDGLSLLILWYIPYFYPPSGNVRYAWILAATFIPVSMSWSSGDVSLVAYIQAILSRVDFSASYSSKHLSALGAVMAFLYSTQIVIYAITSPLLGRYIDKIYNRTGGVNGGDIHGALVNTVGVQFTIIGFIIIAATLVPKGALRVNPEMIYGEKLDEELGREIATPGSASEGVEGEKSRVHVTTEK